MIREFLAVKSFIAALSFLKSTLFEAFTIEKSRTGSRTIFIRLTRQIRDQKRD